MRISEALGAALRARMSGAGSPGEIQVAAGGVELSCEVEAAESLGCAVRRLAARPAAPRNRPAEDLRERAEALCQRATYLLEPLALLEHDPAAGVATLRSSPPAAETTGLEYYEALLRADGSATLHRWRWEPGVPGRTAAPMALSQPQLARLADDLAAAAA